MTDSAIVAHHQ